MKKEKFTEMIGEIDETFVAEVFEEKKPGRIIPFKKIIAVAACICLFAAMATVVIAEVFDIGFEIFSAEVDDSSGEYTAEGYKIDFDIGTFPQDCVGEMEEMRKVLDYKRYGSEYGAVDIIGNHNYLKHFGDMEAALEYIDFYDFEIPDMGLRNERIFVGVSGYSGDELTELLINISDNRAELDEPHIVWNYNAKIYFEGNETAETISFLGSKGDAFTEERYTNDNGIEYLVVKCVTDEGKIQMVRAFLIKNNILYQANMVDYYCEEELEKHMDFIHDWANFY